MSLLTVEHLTKRFGDKEVVKHISFEIQEGHCLTLLGPNGAGKTTTLSMIAGLLSKTSGSVCLNGDSTHIQNHIGFLPQFPTFYPWMTGREYVVFSGRLSNLSKREAVKNADDLLDWVNLGEVKNRKIGLYSGGMKQRLGLAQAFIHRPKLIILDEPVSALDPLGRREVLDMMKKMKTETSLLFSTHVLHDAEEISDDIIIMTDGEIALSGPLNQIKKDKQKPLLRLQSDADFSLLKEGIRQSDVIEEINEVGRTLEIYVRDIDQARQLVLAWILDHHFPITRFESGVSTLEDLFMKVVRR